MRPSIKNLLQTFAVFGILFAVNLTALAQKLSVNDLKVEHLINPLAIETPKPRFSWKIASTVKNTLQSSYEIRVGTNKASINAGKDLVWKSSISTDQSVLIDYSGAELQSKKKYYWQVRVKDNHGNTSGWSEPGFFKWEFLLQIGLQNGSQYQEKILLPEARFLEKSFPYKRKLNRL
ncbi:glycoside hydrolase family 78 protein [Pedobacter steynii]